MYTFSYYMSSVETTHETDDMVSGNFAAGARNPYLTYSDWGWAQDPLGLRYYLEMIYDRYEKPIMVVENGLGAYDTLEEDGSVHDSYRVDYLRDQIKRLELIKKYYTKMNEATKEKTKVYYKEGIRLLLQSGESIENFEQVLEEYKSALILRNKRIDDLYNEIRIIKKLKV